MGKKFGTRGSRIGSKKKFNKNKDKKRNGNFPPINVQGQIQKEKKRKIITLEIIGRNPWRRQPLGIPRAKLHQNAMWGDNPPRKRRKRKQTPRRQWRKRRKKKKKKKRLTFSTTGSDRVWPMIYGRITIEALEKEEREKGTWWGQASEHARGGSGSGRRDIKGRGRAKRLKRTR